MSGSSPWVPTKSQVFWSNTTHSESSASSPAEPASPVSRLSNHSGLPVATCISLPASPIQLLAPLLLILLYADLALLDEVFQSETLLIPSINNVSVIKFFLEIKKLLQ